MGEGGGSAVCINEYNALKESNRTSHGGGIQNINCSNVKKAVEQSNMAVCK
jgi:hypothetical protein